MNAFEINPYIRVALSNSVLSAHYHIKRRVIFDYELIYLKKGEFTFKYNDISYHCKEGQFILIRPGISHSFRMGNKDLHQPHIHFDLAYDFYSEDIPISYKDIDDLTKDELKLIREDIFKDYPIYPFVEFNDKEKFFTLFDKVTKNTENDYLTKKAALTEIISMLIADNFPKCFSNDTVGYSVAKQIKDYIDAGQGIGVRLESFEKQFSYSKYHLEREFKRIYGISLIAYRNNKTMELAARLLKNSNVTEVSERLHFSSIYAFSRAFKKHYGISPSEYKN